MEFSIFSILFASFGRFPEERKNVKIVQPFFTLNMNKQPSFTRHLKEMLNTKEKAESKEKNGSSLEETEKKNKIKLKDKSL